jgi:hypothetical protein
MADTRPLTETMLSEHEPRWIVPDRDHLPGRFGAIAWGLLLLWVSIAIATSVGSGVGLVGAGVIVLGAEVARKWILRLSAERMMVVAGAVFVAGGIVKLVFGQVDPLPVTCLLAGAAVILGIFQSNPSRQRDHTPGASRESPAQ